MSVKMIRIRNLTMYFNEIFFSVDFKIDKTIAEKYVLLMSKVTQILKVISIYILLLHKKIISEYTGLKKVMYT